ncbi:MAG: hypothetical protein MZW92_14820 [Comamonadaceae bacterium]|nr:hypothetical protein [Comamonadaceae bacterium]
MHYVERVGLDYVKKQRCSTTRDGRKALYERLLFALDGRAATPGSSAPRQAGRANCTQFEP